MWVKQSSTTHDWEGLIPPIYDLVDGLLLYYPHQLPSGELT